VFISEQVLYSKRDLDRHNRTGDDAGPLAEAGFKGHPPCHFCRTRFYDSNELYNHMERGHEHCFLCRRNNPNKYVYFRDYAELDGHFQSEHHPCPHPACLERRFVVFPGEAELKRHFAAEHGEEMRMSRAQRREALSVPVQLQFAGAAPGQRGGPRGGRGGRGGGDGGGGGGGGDDAAAAAQERPGVVIGGGAGLQRGGRGGGAAMRHSRSDPAMAAAVAASVESARADAARQAGGAAAGSGGGSGGGEGPQMGSVTFNAADFPAVGGGRAPGAPGGGVALGTWSAATGGSGAGGSGAGPSGAAPSLQAEDFPALPTMSKSQKQRARQKAKSAAATLAERMGATAPTAPRVVNRGALGALGGGGGIAASHSAGNLEAAGAAAAAAGSDDDGGVYDDFPALDGGAGAASTSAAAQAHPSWVPVRSRAPRPRGAGAPAPAAAPPSAAEFPALGCGGGRGAARPSSAAAAVAPPRASRLDSAVAAVAAQGGVSESLKAANRELIERIKEQLDEAGFASFRQQSGAFMRGDLSAAQFHRLVVELGLLPVVARLAELCPAPARRDELLRVHRGFLQSADAHDAASLGRSWMPPEAALAAAAAAEDRGSWPCGVCTLINAPSSRTCEVCGAPRAASAAAARTAAAAPAPAGGGGGARTAAAVVAAPSAFDALPRVSPRGGGGAASQAATAPPPASAGAWPSLGGGGGGSSSSSRAAAGSAAGASASGGDGGSGSSGPQLAPWEAIAEQEAAGGAAGGGKGKGKKAKPVKQSLQQLLTSGRSAPTNAWSQPQRTAELGAAPAVATPHGAWGGKSGGGDKLARQLRATGLGER
jgi:hypothetical protein